MTTSSTHDQDTEFMDTDHDHQDHANPPAGESHPQETPSNPPVGHEPPPAGEDTDPAAMLAATVQERDALAVQVLRLTAALAHGVPVELLTETSEDALNTQAQQLLDFAAKQARPAATDFGGGNRGEYTAPDTDPARRVITERRRGR